MSVLQAGNDWNIERSVFQRLLRERFPLLTPHTSLGSNSQWKMLNEFTPCNTNI